MNFPLVSLGLSVSFRFLTINTSIEIFNVFVTILQCWFLSRTLYLSLIIWRYFTKRSWNYFAHNWIHNNFLSYFLILPQIDNFEDSKAYYKSFYEGFNFKRFFGRYFVFFSCVRYLFYSMFICNFPDQTFFAILILLLFNCVLLSVVLIGKPNNQNLQLLQMQISETLFFIFLNFLLILYVWDYINEGNMKERINLGMIFLILNMFISFSSPF